MIPLAPRRGQRGRAAALASVLALVALLLGGCAVGTSTVATSDVFAAAPWRVGERHEYRLRNSAGDEIGRGVLSTKQQGDRLVLEQAYTEARADGAPPITDAITLQVDAKTLRPVEGARETARRDDTGKPVVTRTSWAYRAGERETLRAKVERPGASTSERELAVRAHAYDNEAALWLWRGIAFAEGYDQAYVSVNPLDTTQQTVSLRVPQREQVEVPAGKFEAWRILLRTGRAVRTAWINTAPPHQIIRWDNGDLIFELVKSE